MNALLEVGPPPVEIRPAGGYHREWGSVFELTCPRCENTLGEQSEPALAQYYTEHYGDHLPADERTAYIAALRTAAGAQKR